MVTLVCAHCLWSHAQANGVIAVVKFNLHGSATATCTVSYARRWLLYDALSFMCIEQRSGLITVAMFGPLKQCNRQVHIVMCCLLCMACYTKQQLNICSVVRHSVLDACSPREWACSTVGAWPCWQCHSENCCHAVCALFLMCSTTEWGNSSGGVWSVWQCNSQMGSFTKSCRIWNL